MASSGDAWSHPLAVFANYCLGVILQFSSKNCYWNLVILLNVVSPLTGQKKRILKMEENCSQESIHTKSIQDLHDYKLNDT